MPLCLSIFQLSSSGTEVGEEVGEEVGSVVLVGTTVETGKEGCVVAVI